MTNSLPSTTLGLAVEAGEQDALRLEEVETLMQSRSVTAECGFTGKSIVAEVGPTVTSGFPNEGFALIWKLDTGPKLVPNAFVTLSW